MRHISLLITLFAGLTLGGCALSPQTVTLSPAIDLAPATLGNGHTVKVLATDTRGNTLVGTRGGIYEETSEIRTDNDIAEALRAQVIAGLTTQGFTVTGNEAKNTLRLAINELRYTVPPGTVATSADIVVALAVTAERNGELHTAVYRSEMNRRFPVAPTAAQNEIWINEVFSETLQRFFADAKMREFLTR